MKTCVGEACILFLCGQTCDTIELQVECTKCMRIVVRGIDIVPIEDETADYTGFNEEISRLMIESLSESAKFEEQDGILTEISFCKTPAVSQ
jgi:serine/threonine-protein kinase RsbW